MSDFGWCPSCKERTGLTARGICAWCDTPLVKARRGGWTRPDLRGGYYTDPQLRALHAVYDRDGLSMNELAKRTMGKVGYTSHHSAAQAIASGWKRLGLPVRDRVEQIKRTCTVHGLAPKHGPRPGYGTHKRRMKRPDQPTCTGTKRQPPRKGERCSRPAMFGSEFCAAHEPSRELQRQAATARMRRRLPPPDMLAFEPFAAWVESLHRDTGSLERTAEVLGCSQSAVHNFLRRVMSLSGGGRVPRTTIGRATVERYLTAAGGPPLDVLYPAERRVA